MVKKKNKKQQYTLTLITRFLTFYDYHNFDDVNTFRENEQLKFSI